MCDDLTEKDNEDWLAARKLTRRELGLLGASAAALAIVPGCGASTPTTSAPMPNATTSASATEAAPTVSRAVTIETPDGKADGFFVVAAGAKRPAVIMWPDIAGVRDAYRTMATRLAEAGYAVLLVNQYYRSSPAPVLTSFAEWRTDAGKAKLKPMIDAITPAGTTRDGAAFVAWLDTQPEVDAAKKIGTCGYCMGGPFTFRTAAAAPARVGALASLHGANLVNDAPDSPHLLLGTMQAALFIAIAENDDAKQPDAKAQLRAAADAAHRPAEIEVYPAQHGWCAIDSPVYEREQAERAWARMLATFQAHL
jgi:carboxymethylenebutenolidase